MKKWNENVGKLIYSLGCVNSGRYFTQPRAMRRHKTIRIRQRTAALHGLDGSKGGIVLQCSVHQSSKMGPQKVFSISATWFQKSKAKQENHPAFSTSPAPCVSRGDRKLETSRSRSGMVSAPRTTNEQGRGCD